METALRIAMAYTCPMHPEIRRTTPKKCPKCGADLVPVGTTPQAGNIATRRQSEAISLGNPKRQTSKRQRSAKGKDPNWNLRDRCSPPSGGERSSSLICADSRLTGVGA